MLLITNLIHCCQQYYFILYIMKNNNKETNLVWKNWKIKKKYIRLRILKNEH